MVQYDDLTIEEICNDGIKKILSEKVADEWTEYDAALACIYGVAIPEGKMPKELLIHTLLTADKYTALALIKRPEVEEYREEAINLFIDRYCANWINKHLSKNIVRYVDDLLQEATRSLIKTIQWWIYSQDITITWKNIERLLFRCNKFSKDVIVEMAKYTSNVTGEPIPDYLLNLINEMSNN